MGLDMMAYRTNAKLSKPVDFSAELETAETVEIRYWRKHPDLHRWMERLYYQKGGEAQSFNCVPVQLTEDDLLALEAHVRHLGLEQNDGGFFFGESQRNEDESAGDLEFIEDARRAIAEGDTVYYDSWW
jgi:hypothetical protein